MALKNSIPAELIDHLMADPEIKILCKKIARHQNRLKKLITKEQFWAYLELEDVVNERLFALFDRAWAAGIEHGRRRDD